MVPSFSFKSDQFLPYLGANSGPTYVKMAPLYSFRIVFYSYPALFFFIAHFVI